MTSITDDEELKMATISDVAKLVGVSRSTVSYALSGKRPVSAEVKERIEAAIAELDYWPSDAARTLATARAHTISLLAPMGENATSAVALQFVNGVALAARRFGYDTLLITGDEAFDGVDRLCRSDQVDGLVLLDVEDNDPRITAIAKHKKPTVLVGHPAGGEGYDRVDLDWLAAGELMVSLLAEKGHRRLALLGAPEVAYALEMTYAKRFRAGARIAAEQHSVELVEIAMNTRYEENYLKLQSTLDARDDITGFVVPNESVAGPLTALLRALGREIPRDVSVAGMGMDVLDPSFVSPFTGIENPSTRITREAVTMLIDQIEGRAAEPRAVLIPGTFKDRGTIAEYPQP